MLGHTLGKNVCSRLTLGKVCSNIESCVFSALSMERIFFFWRSSMSNTNEKKSHGFLKFIIVLLVIGSIIFGVVKFFEYKQTENSTTQQGNNDGNHKLLSRSANKNDISVDSDLELASLGAKYSIIPQTDIDGLEITINFLDSNKNILTSVVKYLGNVKKGVQVNFSISLLDVNLSVAWNTKYESWTVTGGTVSYFK